MLRVTIFRTKYESWKEMGGGKEKKKKKKRKKFGNRISVCKIILSHCYTMVVSGALGVEPAELLTHRSILIILFTGPKARL